MERPGGSQVTVPQNVGHQCEALVPRVRVLSLLHERKDSGHSRGEDGLAVLQDGAQLWAPTFH